MFFLLWCDNFCSPGTGSGSNSYPDPQLCRVFVMVSGRYRHRFLTGLRFYEILRILDVMAWFCFFASHIGDPNCTTEKLLTGFFNQWCGSETVISDPVSDPDAANMSFRFCSGFDQCRHFWAERNNPDKPGHQCSGSIKFCG